jgi:hypothetical protein
MSWVSGIRDPGSGKSPFRIPDPEVEKGTGSRIQVRKTVQSIHGVSSESLHRLQIFYLYPILFLPSLNYFVIGVCGPARKSPVGNALLKRLQNPGEVLQ